MSPVQRYYPTVTQNMETQIYGYLDKSNILSELADECFNNVSSNGTYVGFYGNEILRKSNGYFNTYIPAASIMNILIRDKQVVVATPKDIGTLFISNYGNRICIPVELIGKIEQSVVLTPVQMHEAEHLLSLAGLSLGVTLPPLPSAGDVEMREAIIELARELILSKPRAYRPKFLEKLKLKGYPSKLNEAEFKALVEKLLQP